MHHMALGLVSFQLFCKNLGNLREFFWQMVYRHRPLWQKIARMSMAASGFISDTVEIPFSCFVMDLSRVFRLQHSKKKTKNKRGSVCLPRRDREWSKSSIDEKAVKQVWKKIIGQV